MTFKKRRLSNGCESGEIIYWLTTRKDSRGSGERLCGSGEVFFTVLISILLQVQEFLSALLYQKLLHQLIPYALNQ